MIPKSTMYAAVHNRVICYKGNAKAIRKLVKAHGGHKNNWQTWITERQVGEKVT